jgi:hypothetical protein
MPPANHLEYIGYGFIFSGMLSLMFGFKWLREKYLIENTPTSKIRSLAMGPVEINGGVETLSTVTAPYSGIQCVYCRYVMEEYEAQVINNNVHSGWKVKDKGTKHTLFYLKDDTGKVLVNPQGAEVDIPLLHDMNTGSKRWKEYIILPGQELYLFGTAQDNPLTETGQALDNQSNIIIRDGGNFFYISSCKEDMVREKFKWNIILGMFIGLSLVIIGVMLMLEAAKH